MSKFKVRTAVLKIFQLQYFKTCRPTANVQFDRYSATKITPWLSAKFKMAVWRRFARSVWGFQLPVRISLTLLTDSTKCPSSRCTIFLEPYCSVIFLYWLRIIAFSTVCTCIYVTIWIGKLITTLRCLTDTSFVKRQRVTEDRRGRPRRNSTPVRVRNYAPTYSLRCFVTIWLDQSLHVNAATFLPLNGACRLHLENRYVQFGLLRRLLMT